MTTSEQISSKAVALIKSKGHRATDARVAVLDTLLTAEYALTHHEIEQRLARHGHLIDRVTLYRVLEWALQQGIAHKLTGEDRVWRFNVALTNDHAHFYCTCCGQIYCMENLTPAVAVTLPNGFKLRHTELAIQGLCPQCAE